MRSHLRRRARTDALGLVVVTVGTSGAKGGWSVSGSPYGPRAEPGLASGAPEQVPADQLGRAHGVAADQARLSGTPVDVDLAAVVVLAGRSSHRLGRVLGTHRVDPPGAHALGH